MPIRISSCTVGLLRMSSTSVGGSRTSEVAELRSRVSAVHVLGRVAEHVVRVDERDDEAEGLRQVGAPEPALGLPRVELVPSLARADRRCPPRSARPSRSLRRRAAPSRRTRSRVAADRRRMAPSRPAASRYPPGGSGATCPCRRPHTRPRGASGRGWECRPKLGLAARLRPELQQAPAELRASPAGAAPRVNAGCRRASPSPPAGCADPAAGRRGCG